MRVSFRWLKELLEIKEDLSSIAELLTKKGIGVAEIYNYAQLVENFLVAEFTSIDKNKIILSTGQEEFAIEKTEGVSFNLHPKDKVAFRLTDKKILRGEEIGIGDGVIILNEEFPVGARLDELLDDYVLELEVTSNRGDLMSVFGVARELGIFLDREGKKEKLEIIPESEPPATKLVKLEIESEEDCHCYIGKVLSDVKISPSPFSLQWRLFVSGVRPKYNVVDATNYILLQYGQPLHPFDLNRIFGEKIIVRRARVGEKIKTIDGLERDLSPSVLIIADAYRPIAIAGIMGGANSEIIPSTKRVFLECAHFSPSVIRRGSLYLRLMTEASRRFELGIDENQMKKATEAACRLIVKLSGGRVHQGEVGKLVLPKKETLLFRPERTAQILGVELNKSFIRSTLRKMNFGVTGIGKKKKLVKVTIPSYRRDIKEEIDLIEELARFYGYDNLPDFFTLKGKSLGEANAVNKKLLEISQFLSALGFYEVKSLSFTNEEVIHSLGYSAVRAITNPLNKNFSLLRPALLPTMLPVISFNKRQGNRNLRLFEIGKVYLPEGERYHLAIGLTGDAQPIFWQKKSEAYDFFDIKGIFAALFDFLGLSGVRYQSTTLPFFTLGQQAKIIINQEVGYLGGLAKRLLPQWDIPDDVWYGEVFIEYLISPQAKFYQPISSTPRIKRDFSFLMAKSIPSAAVVELVKMRFRESVKDCEVFDCFSGPPLPPDKKNLGIRITLRATEEPEKVLESIVGEIIKQFKANLRGPGEGVLQ